MLNMQRLPTAQPVNALRVISLVNEALGEIKGYIAIWGSPKHRDSYGTFFDRAKPPDMALDFLPFPIMYEHGQSGKIRKEIIGAVRKIWFDKIGIAFSGTLLQSSTHFRSLIDDIHKKKLKTSSATAGHVADFDAEGRFLKWYLDELSLTENPAESKMPSVELIRSANCTDSECIITPNFYPEESTLAAAGVNVTGKPNLYRSFAMSALLQLLQGDPNAVTPDALIAAAVEDGIDPNSLLAALQQMAAPAAEGMSTALAGEPVPGAQPTGQQPVAQQPAQQPAQPGSVVNDPELLAALQAFIQNRNAGVTPVAGGRSLAITPQQRSAMTAPPVRGNYGGQGGMVISPVNNRTPAARNARIDMPDKYQHLTGDEMATGYMLMRGVNKNRNESPVSETFLRALAYKTAQQIETGKGAALDYAVRSKFPISRPGDVFSTDMTNLVSMRTGEVMDGTTGQGDEWIYDLQGTSLWEAIRNETPVYDAMKRKGMDEAEIPQGFSGEAIPLEGSDPSWYVAPGATDIDSSGTPIATFASSKFGTGQQSVQVAKLSVAMNFQKELEEDSVINIVQEAQRKIRVTAAEQIDYILLNGDTAMGANTNINKIDGTPTAVPARPSYTLLDGIIKLALSAAATRRDAGVAFDETDFLATLKLLPGTHRQNRDKLLYIMDSDSAIAATNIATLKTRDVFSAATLENGALTKLWKIDVLETGFMYLANSAGKVSVTAGNNLYGRLLLVVPRLWASRWKRRLQTEVTYFPYADVTQVVAHMRWGLAYRDANAAAITYNIPETI